MLPPANFNSFLVIIGLLMQILMPPLVRARHKNSPLQSPSTTEPPYLEYFMEHEVTEKEAKSAILNMTRSDLERKPMPWCDVCTDKLRSYCLGPLFLKDHCCCDHRHEQERLPYIPHSCYAGEIQCLPSSVVRHSCITYNDIRECCCDQILRKQYKSMYSSANEVRWPPVLMSLGPLLAAMSSFYL